MEQTIEADNADAATSEVEGTRNGALTVEHGLYVAIVLLAFGLRFINLGVAPLMPLEAAQVWPAWLAATGTQVAGAPVPTSALFYGLQSLLFFVAGANDVLARLLPALVGTALVVLPWWWRDRIGRGAALAVALLLAVDPWLTVLARTADAMGLTVFLGLLTLTALWRWQAQRYGDAEHGHGAQRTAPGVPGDPYVGVAGGPHKSMRATREAGVRIGVGAGAGGGIGVVGGEWGAGLELGAGVGGVWVALRVPQWVCVAAAVELVVVWGGLGAGGERVVGATGSCGRDRNELDGVVGTVERGFWRWE